MQAIVERLLHERVIGNLAVAAGEVLRAGELVREHRRQQVLGVPALELRAACFLPLRKRRTASAVVAFQRQCVANIGASSSACVSTSRTVLLER